MDSGIYQLSTEDFESWENIVALSKKIIRHILVQTRLVLLASFVGTAWEFTRRKLLPKLKDKIEAMDAAIQFLLDQDAKKGREIDLLKERLKNRCKE